MDQFEFEQKAIQLIHINPEGKYQIHPKAENFLKNIPKPISVISVAGLYRTGKSYLLNRILLNRNNGFGVGPTINPCTKGLWCWGTPIKGTMQNGDKINILIVDSEGIGALDEDQNHDVKIFTLAILSSSTFIYNSVGSIDENALQNLSLVVNLTKNIQLSTTQQQEDEIDPDDLAQYFPSFVWVVRDFALQLINSEGDNITPKEYLQRALSPQKGFSDDVEEKNRIRRHLTSFFKDRECATLVRPLINEQKLRNLAQCSFDDLRPEFVEQALILRKRILLNAKPKLFRGETMNGFMYVSMLKSYLEAINNGSVPNIENAWTYMCIQKCLKLQDQCFQFFEQQIQQNIKGNIPCSNTMFESQVEGIEEECLKKFQQQKIGQESRQYFLELKYKIKEKIAMLRIQNQRQSINVLKNYIVKNFSVIEKKMRMNEFQNFQDFLKSINGFYNHLLQNGPDLPKKQIVYLDFLKKVTSQGAQIFLKQLTTNMQSLKMSAEEKQNLLLAENEQIQNKSKKMIEGLKVKIQGFQQENKSIKNKLQQTENKNHEMRQNFQRQIQKQQGLYVKKIKSLQTKNDQLATSLQALKDKHVQLQSSQMIEVKQREKEKALLQLKLSQLNDEIGNLRLKQKSQSLQISQLNSNYTNKLKQMSFDYEQKTNELLNKVKMLSEKYNQQNEEKQFLTESLNQLEKKNKQITKKYQQDIKKEIKKFQDYKNEFESQNISKIQLFEEQNKLFKQKISNLLQKKAENEKCIKDLNEKVKLIQGKFQKQLAISVQKSEFLQQQLSDCKEANTKNVQYYQNLIKSSNEQLSNDLANDYKQKLIIQTQKYIQKNIALQNEMSSMRQKYSQELKNSKTLEQKYQFEHNLTNKKYLNQIKQQTRMIEVLENQKSRLLSYQQQLKERLQKQIKNKQSVYISKMKQLQNELEEVKTKSSIDQEENNQQSQETLKQIKNYYELEKQKLQQRLILQKDKYEKKIQKIRDEYETQIEDQRRTSEEQYENLRDQYTNQATLLKNLVDSLQHENDLKVKQLESLEKRLYEQRQRLQKKEQEFQSKIQSLMFGHNMQKQLMQVKMTEIIQNKNQVEKDMMMITHHKEQASKQLKQALHKLELKSEQNLNLSKTIQNIQNQNWKKSNEAHNQYITQKLNYEKKIALSDQEKQFYCRKLEQYEKDSNKNNVNWQEKIKKIKSQYQEQIKELQTKKNVELSTLQVKYQKLKKNNKQIEQQMVKSISNLERDLALEREKFKNISEKYQELQSKISTDGQSLHKQISSLKSSYTKLNLETSQEISKLKSQISDLENQKNQISSSYEKDKILFDNKSSFLEQIKQKNKKQYQQKIKNLQSTLESIQKTRMGQKTYYEALMNDNLSKTQKKYTQMIQQLNEALSKRQTESQSTIKNLQLQIRSLTTKYSDEAQSKDEQIKIMERKIKEMQQNQKRAMNQLEKYKSNKDFINGDNLTNLEKEKQTLKVRLQERQQKYKGLQKIKQQLYYDFEKQKARWNLQKQNYSMKSDELKDIISKNERDIEKLQRQNEKLKAEKKCSKMSNLSTYGKYSFEKGNSKYNLEDSINSINMSMSKENGNPLGDISFFNQ